MWHHQLLHSCKRFVSKRLISLTPVISPSFAPATSQSIACHRWKPLFLHYRPFSINRLPNPVSPVFLQADKHLGRLAIVDQHGHYSYNDLLHYSAALSEKIISSCIHSTGNQNLSGRHIAFLCENDMSYVVTQWATWMSGAVAVPLCKTHPVRELCYFVKDSQSSLLVVTEEFSQVGEEVLRETGVPLLVIKKEDYRSEYDESANYWLTRFQKRRKVFEEMLSLNEFREKPALIIYTSGTTGKPKGVIVSHGNLYAQIEGMILTWEWTSRDVILHVLPLHHVHGIVNVLMTPLHCGATCVMLTKFDPQAVWAKLLNPVGVNGGLRINLFMAVPTIYAKLIEAFESRGANSYMSNFVKTTCENRIRLMVSGSASLPQPIMERWEEITGHKLLERYGMSEIGMALTNPLNGPRIAGAVGRPMPWVDVCIAKANVYSKYGYDVIAQGNDSYTQVTPGMEDEQGELFVRGPNVFKEYFQRPDSTKRTFSEDGWFKTGDTAVYVNGVYRIMGRTSVDIIKSGGYKISALDIERHLLAHPEIVDCAVVGLPDMTWGQRIAAVLVLSKNGSTEMSVEKLHDWAEDRLPSYQIPTVLKQLDVMPRNAMGKVNKKEILANIFPEYLESSKRL